MMHDRETFCIVQAGSGQRNLTSICKTQEDLATRASVSLSNHRLRPIIPPVAGRVDIHGLGAQMASAAGGVAVASRVSLHWRRPTCISRGEPALVIEHSGSALILHISVRHLNAALLDPIYRRIND